MPLKSYSYWGAEVESKFRLSDCVTLALSCPALLVPPSCWQMFMELFRVSRVLRRQSTSSAPSFLFQITVYISRTLHSFSSLSFSLFFSSFLLFSLYFLVFLIFHTSSCQGLHIRFSLSWEILTLLLYPFYCFSFRVWAALPDFKVLPVFFPCFCPTELCEALLSHWFFSD